MNLNPYRLKHLWTRLGQAWRLARGRTTREDARDLHWMIEDRAGWHTLESIDVEGVLERIRDLGCDDPRAEEWAERAAARVGSKWSSTGDIAGAAIDWEIELVAEYAKDDGVDIHADDEKLEAEPPNA